jgi:hypothetical protein
MDEFWTADEAAFRKRTADYFRRRGKPRASCAAACFESIWTDLHGASGADGAVSPPRCRLSGSISIIEEAACQDPKLGRELFEWRAAAPLDPVEELACRLGRLAGTATYVLESGAGAARERGSFSSSLMGCREVQESLAGLVSGAAIMRLGSCRLCRLLERGERDRAVRESAMLDARARALAADVRSAARLLLGDPWVEANIPADDRPF